MSTIDQPIQVRWSDLDPNLHVRHSIYYDWAATYRVIYFSQHGLTVQAMNEAGVGFILLREECVFRREIRVGDEVTMKIQIAKARRDFSRVTIQHQIYKNGDTLAATLTIDGAWIDIAKRKLAAPPAVVGELFEKIPSAKDFQWEDE